MSDEIGRRVRTETGSTLEDRHERWGWVAHQHTGSGQSAQIRRRRCRRRCGGVDVAR